MKTTGIEAIIAGNKHDIIAEKAARYASFIGSTAVEPAIESALLDVHYEEPGTPEDVRDFRKKLEELPYVHPMSIFQLGGAELSSNAMAHNSLRRVLVGRSAGTEDNPRGMYILRVYDDGEQGTHNRTDRGADEGGLGLAIITETTPYYGRTDDYSWFGVPVHDLAP